MSEKYSITAKPVLYAEGEYQGKLKGITFVASHPSDTREWFTKNCGHFEHAFTRLLPPDQATSILHSLTHGQEVTFPGDYEVHQFADGFMFEWTPLYFVHPPRLAFS
jgi:hypothetical protein